MKIIRSLFVIILIFTACSCKRQETKSEPEILPTPQDISSSPTDLVKTDYTPYDAYLREVKSVLRELPIESPSYDVVASKIAEVRKYPYDHRDPYLPQSPKITGLRKRGDCKDKALYLLSELGGNVSFIIGKLPHRSNTMNHAWLEWTDPTYQTYILDPALKGYLLPKNDASGGYRPLYRYSREGSFRYVYGANVQ